MGRHDLGACCLAHRIARHCRRRTVKISKNRVEHATICARDQIIMVSRFCAGQCWHGYTSILIAEYLKEETPVLIDVHSHIAPLTLPACPGAEEAARWPCMQCQSATQATILMGSKPFRELDDRSWNASRRIADMDREGVDIQ